MDKQAVVAVLPKPQVVRAEVVVLAITVITVATVARPLQRSVPQVEEVLAAAADRAAVVEAGVSGEVEAVVVVAEASRINLAAVVVAAADRLSSLRRAPSRIRVRPPE